MKALHLALAFLLTGHAFGLDASHGQQQTGCGSGQAPDTAGDQGTHLQPGQAHDKHGGPRDEPHEDYHVTRMYSRCVIYNDDSEADAEIDLLTDRECELLQQADNTVIGILTTGDCEACCEEDCEVVFGYDMEAAGLCD